jgi:hypothetical protein
MNNKIGEKEKLVFQRIGEGLRRKDSHVRFGKMMSSPGLKAKGRVFAFYWKRSMVFRLGEEFDPHRFGLARTTLLNPFKTKGPLKGWYVVDNREQHLWRRLAGRALKHTMERVPAQKRKRPG